MALLTRGRNLLSLGCVYAFVLALWVVGPPSFQKRAEVRCASGTVVQIPDMDECFWVPEYQKEGCACFRVRNEWHRPYVLGLVPLLTTLLAYMLFRGPLTVRLLLLNGAFTAAAITQFIWALFDNAAAALLTLPWLPIVLAAFWFGMSLVFVCVMFLHKHIFRSTNTESA